MKLTPEFVLMMVLTTKPQPLLVALWGVSTKRSPVQDKLRGCTAGKVGLAVS